MEDRYCGYKAPIEVEAGIIHVAISSGIYHRLYTLDDKCLVECVRYMSSKFEAGAYF
ncbi:hypothetical protein FOPG_19678 [Fusarium oxysporum f. sp. conglutinans race 2 54008]|uniref:Uncharacterized protein n=1 Tax=Fusarium oxysporum f. sp. conglutinans race 2 54008 TaxID=1089457 RepID=X0GK85_FUSOX|nr:hypothetical protein FOPG_19678 [Fusarium oxysporum f. sp. conglutinans race 2 54008]